MKNLEVQLTNLFDQLTKAFWGFMPNLIHALGLLLVGLIASYLVGIFSNLAVTNFYRLIPNSWESRKSLEKSLRTTGFLTGKLLFWITLIVFILLATDRLGVSFISGWLQDLKSLLPKVLSAFVIAIFGWHLAVFVRTLVEKAATQAKLSYASLLASLTHWSVFLISLFIAVKEIGLDLSLIRQLLVVALGSMVFALSLAMAFGAKDVIANILSSYHIQRAFKLGTKIKIDDIEGKVVQFTASEVVVHTSSGRLFVPARKFASQAFIVRDS